MSNNPIKLIASDMDGTLLNAQHQLPEGFHQLIDRLHAQGVLFVAASGRQYYNLLHCFGPSAEKMAFIAENGSLLALDGEFAMAQALPRTEVLDFMRLVRNIPHTEMILCGLQSGYIQNPSERFESEVRKYYHRCQVVDDLEAVQDDILKIAICCFAGSEEHVAPHFKAYEHSHHASVSGYIWFDVSRKDASKGVALQALQARMGIGPEHTMVFGDYLNDLDMMQQAYYSYAMENAHPQLKEVARFEAPSNEQQGVATVIREQMGW